MMDPMTDAAREQRMWDAIERRDAVRALMVMPYGYRSRLLDDGNYQFTITSGPRAGGMAEAPNLLDAILGALGVS